MKKYFPFLFIVLGAILIHQFALNDSMNLVKARSTILWINDHVENNFALFIIVYMLFFIALVLFVIPGAPILAVAAGIFLGQTLGTIITVVSATIGASILFFSAKMVYHDIEKELPKWIDKLNEGFKQDAFFYLLTLRLIPLFPFYTVNLACIFLRIPFKTFVTATFLGIIPASFVFTSIGVAMSEIIDNEEFSPTIIVEPKIILALCGLGLLALLPVLYKKIKKTK